MRELLKIEYLKIKHYTVFRAFMLLYICLVPLIFYGVSLVEIPMFRSGVALFKFPLVWDYLPYIASWFNVLPGILIVALVCNEVSYKTQKQNVIDGLSRLDVILSKFYVVFVLTLITVGLVFVLGVIFGATTSNISNIFAGIESMLYFAIQTLATLALALLVAVIIRKSALAILAYLVIFLFAGLIIQESTNEVIAGWMPFNMMNDLTPNPWISDFEKMERMMNPAGQTASPEGIPMIVKALGTLVYTVGFVALSYIVMKKRDL